MKKKSKMQSGKVCLALNFKNGDPIEVYPLDDPKAAVSCFSVLSQTYDCEPEITIDHFTATQWKKAVRAGKKWDNG